MDNKILFGIIGVLILTGAGTITLLQLQEDPNLYICSQNNNTARFESLSSTNKTGYWYVDGVRKQATCTNGIWERPSQWAERFNVSMDTISDLQGAEEDVLEEDIVKFKCLTNPEITGIECISMIDAVCIDKNNVSYKCEEWAYE